MRFPWFLNSLKFKARSLLSLKSFLISPLAPTGPSVRRPMPGSDQTTTMSGGEVESPEGEGMAGRELRLGSDSAPRPCSQATLEEGAQGAAV